MGLPRPISLEFVREHPDDIRSVTDPHDQNDPSELLEAIDELLEDAERVEREERALEAARAGDDTATAATTPHPGDEHAVAPSEDQPGDDAVAAIEEIERGAQSLEANIDGLLEDAADTDSTDDTDDKEDTNDDDESEPAPEAKPAPEAESVTESDTAPTDDTGEPEPAPEAEGEDAPGALSADQLESSLDLLDAAIDDLDSQIDEDDDQGAAPDTGAPEAADTSEPVASTDQADAPATDPPADAPDTQPAEQPAEQPEPEPESEHAPATEPAAASGTAEPAAEPTTTEDDTHDKAAPPKNLAALIPSWFERAVERVRPRLDRIDPRNGRIVDALAFALGVTIGATATYVPIGARRVSVVVSKPLAKQPHEIRNAVGWVALWTLFLGVVVWSYMLLFRTPAIPTPSEAPTRVTSPDERSGAASIEP